MSASRRLAATYGARYPHLVDADTKRSEMLLTSLL